MMKRYTVKTNRQSVTWQDRWLLVALCLSLMLPLAVNARLIDNNQSITRLTSDLVHSRAGFHQVNDPGNAVHRTKQKQSTTRQEVDKE